MENCVFCKIIAGRCPDTKIEYENEALIVFKDIKPASDFHFLAVPRKHYDSAKVFKTSDEDLLKNMEDSLKSVLRNKGADLKTALFGFHWPPFTSIRHVHMHAIAPTSNMGIISRMIFKPDSFYFRSPQYVRENLTPDND